MPYFGYALGCGHFSTATEDRKNESARIISAALDRKILYLDAADFYGGGESELAIREALKTRSRDRIFISLKLGALIDPKGQMYGLDVHPDRIKNYLTHSLRRLGTDYVNLIQPVGFDRDIPVEETMGAFSDLVREGHARRVGVSQVDEETLRRAHAVHDVTCVELDYSLFNRSMEQDVLPAARALGIDVIATGVLAHGLLGGDWTAARGAHPHHAQCGLFHPGNLEKNLLLVERFKKIAAGEGITLPQLALAWAHAKAQCRHGDDIIPVIAVSTMAQFLDCAKAQEITLSEETAARIDRAIKPGEIAGSACPRRQFKGGKMTLSA